MKAAFLTKEGFVLENIPDPALKGDGVILKVEACGVCGSDLRAWRYRKNISKRIIRGHEVAGIVVEKRGNVPYEIGTKLALGADINCLECPYCRRGEYNLCINKKILGNDVPGGFAQYMVLDKHVIEHGIINEMPESMDFSEGAFAEPLSSVVALNRRFRIGLGDVVVIFGSGPMGCLNANVSLISGAAVILADISQQRLEIAKDILGASVVYVNNAKEDLKEIVMELTGGQGADFAITAAPSSAAQKQSIHLLKRRGTTIFFGGLPHDASDTFLNANLIHYYEITVTGSFSYNPWDHKLALKLLSQKKIDARKYIKEFPLEKISDVFEELSEGKNKDYLKAIIKPWR